MDFFTALKQNINEYIVANGNKEITADILRPILLEICNITFAKMGDLELLQTVYKNDLVGAINEALNAESGVKIHYGTFPDPNDATIPNFELGDFYAQQGDTGIDSFWQYNGQSWVKIADSDSQSGVQSVTGDGVDNTDPENPVLTFPTPAEIGAIEDAPSDGKTYGRKNEAWTETTVHTNNTSDIELSGDGTQGTPLEAELTQEVKDDIDKGVDAYSWGDWKDGDLDDMKNESEDPFARYSDLEDDEKLNVKFFGAKGDGVTDDTEAIRSVMEEAKTRDVKNVFFPQGDYKITGTIYIPSNVKVFGMGMNSSRIFLEDNSSEGLDIITPVNYTSTTDNRGRYKAMIVSETSDYINNSWTENIRVSDLELDWGINPCLGYSIATIIIGRTRNSEVERVKISDAFPSDFENTLNNLYGCTILFAIADDCKLRDSIIGSSDYESISIRYISNRIHLYNNVFISDKPETYNRQSHQIQITRPSFLSNELMNEFGREKCRNVFIYDNVFLMIRNTTYMVTSHSSDGIYIRNNYGKYFDTLQPAYGFKPFDNTINFEISGNIIDLTEYQYDPLSSPMLMIGSYIGGNERVQNGIISGNQIYCKSDINRQVFRGTSPLIGGVFSGHQNILISNNNVHISGTTTVGRSIFGITGINCQVINNNVYLENQEEIQEDELSFFSTRGIIQGKVSGNQVFGKISKGVRVDGGSISNLKIHSNQWNTIKEVDSENDFDFEIFTDDVKEREGITKIQLDNSTGHRYNFNNPLSEEVYEFFHPKIGGKAFVKINSHNKPVLLNAILEIDNFSPNTDVLMEVWVEDENIIKYSLLEFSQNPEIWLSDITEFTAEINFRGISHAQEYDVYINGYFYQKINQSGDKITGLDFGTIYSVKIELPEGGFTPEVTFRTIEAEFVTIWDTEQLGSTDNNQIKLPLISSGAYDFVVRYNGEEIKSVNSYQDNIVTFPDGAGIKQINIVGVVSGFGYNNSAENYEDKNKLIEIVQFGHNFTHTNGLRWLQNCKNLIAISDDLDGEMFTSCEFMFSETGIIHFPKIDFPNSTTVRGMFEKAVPLETVESFDIGNSENIAVMFRNTNIEKMPDFDFSKVNDFNSAFRSLKDFTEFNPRDFRNMNSAVSMLSGTSIPTEAWSEILINLDAHNPNDNVTLHGGNSKYNSSAVQARNNLISRGWVITDGGLE